MPTISDSNAVRSDGRVFSQHQAALTLLQASLSEPGKNSLDWLDLACGRGQIISGLQQNISESSRARIRYCGYDLDQSYARETEQTATGLGFADCNVKVGDLEDFPAILPNGSSFDFVTLTNTLHEISPSNLAKLLVDCLRHLTPNGTFYLYDMETIAPPELGAISWKRDEIRNIIHQALRDIGVDGYLPEVSWWQHSSTTGWSVAIDRKHFNKNDDWGSDLSKTDDVIFRTLQAKKTSCEETLEIMTKYGVETAKEEQHRETLLHDYWSINRVLGEFE